MFKVLNQSESLKITIAYSYTKIYRLVLWERTYVQVVVGSNPSAGDAR